MEDDSVFDEVIRDMERISETNWGPWKLHRDTRNVYMETPTHYSLPIHQLSPTSIVLTLKHVSDKTWADNECLGGLFRAARSIWDASADPISRL